MKTEMDVLMNAKKHGSPLEELYNALTWEKTSGHVTLQNAMDEWLKECESGTVKRSTFQKYQQAGEEFLEYMKAGEKGPLLRQISRENISGYLLAKREKVRPTTANQFRGSLSTFFEHQLRSERIQRNPVALVKPFRREAILKRAFTIDEITRMLKVAPDPFWKYLISGGFATGLRLSDLIRLRVGDVDFENLRLAIKTQKTGRLVAIKLKGSVAALLQEQIARLPAIQHSDFIWPEHAQRVEKQGKAGYYSAQFRAVILDKCGLGYADQNAPSMAPNSKTRVSEICFHSLRRSFVSCLKSTGTSMSAAKELAGHSTNAISDLYTTVSAIELDRAIDSLPDLNDDFTQQDRQ